MHTPAVSVLIPTYNRAAFVGRAIEQVLGQTWTDLELLVVNDRSTDDTATVLSDWQKRDRRLRIINNNQGPHGPAGARNAGLAEARAPWVAFLDSDDEWEADKIAHFMPAAGDGVTLIGSNYFMVREDGQPSQTMWDFVSTVMIPWWSKDPLAQPVIPAQALRDQPGLLADPRVVRGMAMGGFLWPHTSSVMVRRSAVQQAGGFNARLLRTEDMHLWLDLLNLGRFVYVDRPLGRYHIQGREAATGQRYESHAENRRHTHYEETLAHLNFFRSLRKRYALQPVERRYLQERLRMQHLYCARAAGADRPLAARWHAWWAGHRFRGKPIS